MLIIAYATEIRLLADQASRTTIKYLSAPGGSEKSNSEATHSIAFFERNLESHTYAKETTINKY